MAAPVGLFRLSRQGWRRHAAWPLAIAFGVYWGHATVSAFRPDYLPTPSYAALHDPSQTAGSAYGAPELAQSGCGGDCSDYDLGYRWASASDADAAGECQDASWSFRRGCLAYLRAEGHFLTAPEPANYAAPDLYSRPAYLDVKGKPQRDGDLEPFQDATLSLPTATPTIDLHGAVQAVERPVAHDAAPPVPPLPTSATPVEMPAPIASAQQVADTL